MDTPVPAEIQGQVGPCQFDYDKVHLGMISQKKSLITIFGHKHFRQKFDIFHEKNSTASGSYLV